MAYLVTAKCDNDRCKTRLFQIVRERMTYMAGIDDEHVIQSIRCPDCGGWANVMSTPKLTDVEDQISHFKSEISNRQLAGVKEVA